jgi:hypothetical protein
MHYETPCNLGWVTLTKHSSKEYVMRTMTVVLMMALVGTIAQAETFTIGGKEVTKRDALIALVKDPKTKVLKITEVELSEKGTLKNKKKSAE